ncbi:hypothetical protein [Lewinella sp. IMCC34183]|uniref:hypothetical protein n=1 Tax=Lewinella sp. IMCC34183 TaxID=2248762 RepID=UPI000E22A09C|nr:hypothetical protein [Lewinella sp. IMCC34183]
MPHPYLSPRREGDHHDTVSMRCLDQGGAAAYHRAVDRFYAVGSWHELNSALRTHFQLCDGGGKPVERRPRVGDTIRIDLAGPGSRSGGGYDWVAVTLLDSGEEPLPFVAMSIVPCADPRSATTDVAHFYAAGAVNTFVLRRLGDCLLAEVHGRNEVPNVGTGPLVDRLRNEAIALAGRVGFSQVQWKDWTDGLVSVV